MIISDEMASAAEKGWTTLFTADDLTGNVDLGDKYKLNVIPSADGFGVAVRAKVRKGTLLLLR